MKKTNIILRCTDRNKAWRHVLPLPLQSASKQPLQKFYVQFSLMQIIRKTSLKKDQESGDLLRRVSDLPSPCFLTPSPTGKGHSWHKLLLPMSRSLAKLPSTLWQQGKQGGKPPLPAEQHLTLSPQFSPKESQPKTPKQTNPHKFPFKKLSLQWCPYIVCSISNSCTD